MTQLPVLSGKRIIKGLEKLGYREDRRRGSHIRLHCSDKRSVTVPDYRTIGIGLFRKILRDAEVSLEDFMKILDE